MACIQPSFLYFYLFRAQQHNTSFLLISKDELKYPRGSFLNNQNFYPFGQQHFPSQEQLKTESQIFQYIQQYRQDFSHIHNSNLPPPFQISQKTFSKTKIKPHSRGNSTNQSVLQYHKILKSILRGIHKIPSTTNLLEIFSTPLWGRPPQNLVWLLPVPKIYPIQGRTKKKHFQFPQLLQTSKPVPQP